MPVCAAVQLREAAGARLSRPPRQGPAASLVGTQVCIRVNISLYIMNIYIYIYKFISVFLFRLSRVSAGTGQIFMTDACAGVSGSHVLQCFLRVASVFFLCFVT